MGRLIRLGFAIFILSSAILATAQEEQITFSISCPSNISLPPTATYRLSADGTLTNIIPRTHTQYSWLDDERVSFTRLADDALEIYILSLEETADTTALTPFYTITHHAHSDFPEESSVSWGSISPNGRYYAFSIGVYLTIYDATAGQYYSRPDETLNGLYVLDMLTNRIGVAGRYHFDYRRMNWASDSRRLAFYRDDGEIGVADVDNLANSRWAFPDNTRGAETFQLGAMSWSGDGTAIAYIEHFSMPRKFLLLDVDTNTTTVIYETRNAVSQAPIWSRAGDRLLITEFNYAESVSLRTVVDMETLTAQTIPHLEGAQHLTWSPDDTWLAFSRATDDGNAIYIMDVQNHATITLVQTPNTVTGLRWQQVATSPDSQTLQVGDTARVYVLDDGLSLRDEPTIRGTLLQRLPAGTQVEIVGDVQLADGYRWWQVSTDEGIIGWSVESADNIITLQKVLAPQAMTIPLEPITVVCE